MKVHILEIGSYRTAGTDSIVKLPVHPAYTEPSLVTQMVRSRIETTVSNGDPAKAARIIEQLTRESNLPLRIPVGKDSIGYLRTKVATLTKSAHDTEKYSASLTFDA